MKKRTEHSGEAFVLSDGKLKHSDAKTTHGLIRGSSRFAIKAVIDPIYHGHDAGEVLDGIKRGIPVFATLREAMEKKGKPDYCIVGLATTGGMLPPGLEKIIREAISNGISVISGLHDYLQDKPGLVCLAKKYGTRLIDVRKPRPFEELHFWTPEIFSVKCPVVAVLGTDCAIGKRTSTRFILEACKDAGINAEMIYTGQTGWMQGVKYGFIFDSTLNDFVCGELAHAIISAYRNESPDIILLEGQSALRNPSGPCGAEFLLSGNARYVILVHGLKREYYDDNSEWGPIPSVESEIKLINLYGSEVIALMLNTGGCSPGEVETARQELHSQLNIPVLLPLEEGVGEIIPVLKKLYQDED